MQTPHPPTPLPLPPRKKKKKGRKGRKKQFGSRRIKKRESSGRNNFKPVYYFSHQKPFTKQKASEKLWTKRAHRGGTGDNLFERKSCKAKVTSKTTQKWGMLACSSLLHCGVAMLVCSVLLVRLFLSTDYLGTIFPVLYAVFRTKLSSKLQDWNSMYFSCNTPFCKMKCLGFFVCLFLYSCIYNSLYIYLSWVFKVLL